VNELEQAKELLELDEKWLQPFHVVDPFNGLPLAGYLSIRPDHRYGALAILAVDGRPAPQRIFATPKLRHPFDRNGDLHFPPVRRIDIYEKLDGTNVLAYRYRDADGGSHLTYKLRLHPVLRNGRWGAFLDLWREILVRYPQIPQLVDRNGCSISFELFGSRNVHLMVYDVPLDTAVLFAVESDARPRPPAELDTLGVPTAPLLGRLEARHDPVAEYARIRERLQADIRPQDDEKLAGPEGAVWYVTTAAGERVLFKCKPESVEAIHWKGGISKEAVRATCWNLLETEDTLSFAALEPLLLEEYQPDDIERFRPHIHACIREVNAQLAFRNRVLDAYRAVGVRLGEDKGAVMRAMSRQFSRAEMKKVYAVIARFGEG
jgi:hypothetical protein